MDVLEKFSMDTFLANPSIFTELIEKLTQPEKILICVYLLFKSGREVFTYKEVKQDRIEYSGKHINAQFKMQFYNHVKREFFKLIKDDHYTVTER